MGALGATLFQRFALRAAVSPASEPAPQAPSQPRPVVVREVVREIVREPNTRETAAAVEPPQESQEELEARVEAELEAGFQLAPGADAAARDAETVLSAAFDQEGVRASRVECRTSYCRIEASFDDEMTSRRTLSRIFLSEPDERLPNLASTVTSHTVDPDGTAHVKIYLHPD